MYCIGAIARYIHYTLKPFMPMNIRSLSISAIAVLCLGMAGAQAQTAVPAAGGNATGTGGSASYTVGQPAYTTQSSAAGSVAQGVQQGYAVTVISSQAGTDGITCTVYPNPATDYVQLDIAGSTASNLQYQLTDQHGRLLQQGAAAIGSTRIELGDRAQATYYLRVADGSKDLKSFQIIKN
jgi:hypothetical protein